MFLIVLHCCHVLSTTCMCHTLTRCMFQPVCSRSLADVRCEDALPGEHQSIQTAWTACLVLQRQHAARALWPSSRAVLACLLLCIASWHADTLLCCCICVHLVLCINLSLLESDRVRGQGLGPTALVLAVVCLCCIGSWWLRQGRV